MVSALAFWIKSPKFFSNSYTMTRLESGNNCFLYLMNHILGRIYSCEVCFWDPSRWCVAFDIFKRGLIILIFCILNEKNVISLKHEGHPDNNFPVTGYIRIDISNASTHWGRDNMAAILQKTFSNKFSWKCHLFWSEFHWCLLLRFLLTIC